MLPNTVIHVWIVLVISSGIVVAVITTLIISIWFWKHKGRDFVLLAVTTDYFILSLTEGRKFAPSDVNENDYCDPERYSSKDRITIVALMLWTMHIALLSFQCFGTTWKILFIRVQQLI